MSTKIRMVEVECLADVHNHPRQGRSIMRDLIAASIKGGADTVGAMPNTTPGLTTPARVIRYRDTAQSLVAPGQSLNIIPFLMITENTTEKEVDACIAKGVLDGKVYPYLRTTKSEDGVRRYGRLIPIIRYCGKVGMKVHFHPEHPSMLFGNREAEFVFVPLARMFLEETDAIIVWEHGTDGRCIPHWKDMAASGRFFVTLTAHHLATNEDDMFGDVAGVCKPPIKTEADRRSLVDLVGEDYPWVMAGTDSAFHRTSAKHVKKGKCACGDFTAPFALPLYAHALEKLFHVSGGVTTFVNFTSRNARKLHHLPDSSRKVTLMSEQWTIPLSYKIGRQTAMPFWAGQTLNWMIARD